MTLPPEGGADPAAMRRALAALRDLRARAERAENALREPIAIIGIGCRFPGGATDPDRFWELLRNGVDAVEEVPKSRWDIDAYYDPDPEVVGRMYSRHGGFLQEPIDEFDARFFGISPRESLSLDPQQRLLLETAWAAIEHAGIAPGSLAGSSTGVYVGISTMDFYNLTRTLPSDQVDPYAGTGTGYCTAAGRISYSLGLQGPNIALDTACSSSLVATTLAVQALRAGACSMALAGGVNVMLSPATTTYMCNLRALSFQGRCKSFDASADGYVRGEGCGILVLKRLSDALQSGDPVISVIRGAAYNHGGRSGGLTVPNGAAQRAVIEAALADAGISPSDVGYVEAHGTGTPLGDPIEIRALADALGKDRTTPVLVGSVKTNIGHLEAAAGVAALAKTALSIQRGIIPAHLHFASPNPHLDWERLPVEVVAVERPWARGARRVAGVSSFGISGTNAHVILEAAPERATEQPTPYPVQVVVVSGLDEAAARTAAARLADRLESPDVSFGGVAAAAALGRTHLPSRVAVTAVDAAEAAAALRAIGDARGDVVTRPPVGAARIGFVFTGQGAQYPGMGRALYQGLPPFREVVDKCLASVDPGMADQLRAVFTSPADPNDLAIHRTGLAQPALFVIEYALAEVLSQLGVRPQVVMGHSIGEFVAACRAGALGLEDGLRLVTERGRLMESLPAGGAMAAVALDEAAARELCRELDLDLAAINGPSSAVIAGDEAIVAAAIDRLKTGGIDATRLTVSHAFHSRRMDGILDSFERAAGLVAFSDPRIRLISNRTGRPVTAGQLHSSYWRDHLRGTVLFSAGVAAMAEQGVDVVVEIGPQPTLLRVVGEILGDGPRRVPTLRRGRDDWRSLGECLAGLYSAGVDLDWAAWFAPQKIRQVSIPTYPFARTRSWPAGLGLGGSGDRSRRRHSDDAPSRLLPGRTAHPMVAGKVASAAEVFESGFNTNEPAFLADHRVAGLTLFPATGYLELALAAASDARPGALRLDAVSIEEALLVPDEGTLRVQIVLSPLGEDASSFQVFSAAGDRDDAPQWKRHASGKVSALEETSPADLSLNSIRGRMTDRLEAGEFYSRLVSLGAEYGPTFQGVREIHRGPGEVLGRVELPAAVATGAAGYRLHPALLDACLQLTAAATLDAADAGSGGDVHIPVSIESLEVFRAGASEAWCHVTLSSEQRTESGIVSDLTLADADGKLIARVRGLTLRRVPRKTLERLLQASNESNWLFELAWRVLPSPAAPATARRWLIVGEGAGLGAELATRLRADGHVVDLLTAGTERVRVGDDWRADLSEQAQVVGVLADVVASGPPLHGVVYLAGLDSPGFDAGYRPLGAGLVTARNVAVAAAGVGARLWIVTAGSQRIDASMPDPTQAPLWGLGGVVATEYPGMPVVRVDLPPSSEPEVAAVIDALLQPDDESQIGYRNGARHVARMVRSSVTATSAEQPRCLEIPTRGQLDALEIRSVPRIAPGPGQVEILVHASGLNFRDVLNALGMYPGDPGPLGNECAGVVTAVGPGVEELMVGDEVIALADRTFATYVVAPAILTVKKPARLTFAEAATIPVTFLTAHYALTHLGRMKAGDRVLIHAATGGVGMAAMQLARRSGAVIFGTAGTPAKRDLAKSLGAHHVADSRSLSFAEEIGRAAGGEKMDIALNSLAGDFIPRTLELLAPGGRFIEIGKTDVWDQAAVEARFPGLSYFIFFLGQLAASDPVLLRGMLEELLVDFERGELTPLPQHHFPLDKAAEAFRFMAQAKHTGKVVVTQRHDLVVRSDASYLITGGLGGLGLAVARWLVGKGARDLILVSRRAPNDGARAAIGELEGLGARVTPAVGDVADAEDVRRLLETIERQHHPLRGVIHAAGIVEDRMLPGLDRAAFDRVLAPKVAGSWHLHALTEHVPLDFFVMFSSIAAILGSPGQGNYAAANLFMDGLARRRHAEGRPALTIDWGSWSDVGMAAEVSEQHRRRWASLGVSMISPDDGMRILGDLLMAATNPCVAVVPLVTSKLSASTDPFFQELGGTSAAVDPRAPANLLEDLKAASPDDRHSLLVDFLDEQLVRVLALGDSYRVDVDRSIIDMGMDSLMAMELRNRIDSRLKVAIAVADLLAGPTVAELATVIERRLPFSSESLTGEVARQEAENLLESLDALSEDDLDAQLHKLLSERGDAREG